MSAEDCLLLTFAVLLPIHVVVRLYILRSRQRMRRWR